MYFDGSVMKTGAGVGLLFVSPLKVHIRYMAEYEALLSGLRIAIELSIKCLDVREDSQLVIDKVMKESSGHDPKMEAYCNAVRRLKDKFDSLELNHIARKYNNGADKLTKIRSGWTTVPLNIFARDLAKPSVDFKEPSGATATEPTVEDPSASESEAMETEAEISSADEAKVMQIDEAPLSRDWRDQYLD
jgi:hypothetical protein